MELHQYLAECRALSLTARAIIALLIVERLCAEHSISHPEVDSFLNYLWRWPEIDGPDMFDPWQSSRPKLVDYGLGGDLPENFERILETAGVSELRFRAVISGTVGILWGSFWAAADDEGSLACFEQVVQRAKLIALPPLTPFKFSRVADGAGWGERLTADDCAYWASLRDYSAQTKWVDARNPSP